LLIGDGSENSSVVPHVRTTDEYLKMFISDESYSVRVPGLFGNGQSAWRMLERQSMDPWYQVVRRICEGSGHRIEKLIATSASVLAEILADSNKSNSVEVVQVITPPWMNATSLDRMEKLVDLIAGYDHRGECVLLHTVESGAVYSTSSDGAVNASLLTETRTIYKDTKPNASAVQK
jgi:hypothetical protein